MCGMFSEVLGEPLGGSTRSNRPASRPMMGGGRRFGGERFWHENAPAVLETPRGLADTPGGVDMSKRTEQASDKVVVAAPMSYAGSAARLWKLARLGPSLLKVITVPLAIILVVVAWAAVSCWYAVFGILLWPYRLLRRGQRKDRRAALRHQELLEAARRQDQAA